MDFNPSFRLDNLLLAENPRANAYMANAIFALPVGASGQFQPHAAGGVGGIQLVATVFNIALPHPSGTFPTGTTEGDQFRVGTNIGGGLMGFAGMIGFRADARYYSANSSEGSSRQQLPWRVRTIVVPGPPLLARTSAWHCVGDLQPRFSRPQILRFSKGLATRGPYSQHFVIAARAGAFRNRTSAPAHGTGFAQHSTSTSARQQMISERTIVERASQLLRDSASEGARIGVICGGRSQRTHAAQRFSPHPRPEPEARPARTACVPHDGRCATSRRRTTSRPSRAAGFFELGRFAGLYKRSGSRRPRRYERRRRLPETSSRQPTAEHFIADDRSAA